MLDVLKTREKMPNRSWDQIHVLNIFCRQSGMLPLLSWAICHVVSALLIGYLVVRGNGSA